MSRSLDKLFKFWDKNARRYLVYAIFGFVLSLPLNGISASSLWGWITGGLLGLSVILVCRYEIPNKTMFAVGCSFMFGVLFNAVIAWLYGRLDKTAVDLLFSLMVSAAIMLWISKKSGKRQ
ncbi:hypothetical protein KSF_039550 [Reticulibacter mediterranei]|uniref:Uncharacterized protein n=1 Tax=Reticulibacter mediterranei TaxID=2778369 RepID=A0A8J3N1E9_9CHLR|nr:hypothetical protein [Reticulibacter mediterranei]GHO93907.1 hypothetical protein KSF_039550 [Reticulibacter mediterranei]